MELVKETMRALAFLSRLPVSPHWFAGYSGSLHDTVRGFPLAGMIIALPASIFLLVAVTLDLPEMATALFVIVALIVTTGALHEDGLADVADGFYGGNSVERRLEIMKDSSIGSYGTLALIVSVLLRTALLATIVDEVGPFQAVIIIVGTEAGSRAALVKFWQSLPSARAGGVADRAGIAKCRRHQFCLFPRRGHPCDQLWHRRRTNGRHHCRSSDRTRFPWFFTAMPGEAGRTDGRYIGRHTTTHDDFTSARACHCALTVPNL